MRSHLRRLPSAAIIAISTQTCTPWEKIRSTSPMRFGAEKSWNASVWKGIVLRRRRVRHY